MSRGWVIHSAAKGHEYDTTASINFYTVESPKSVDFERDNSAKDEFLAAIRYGGKPEILFDDLTGWELFMADHSVYFPLKSSAAAVNMILGALAEHYRRTTTGASWAHIDAPELDQEQ